MTPLDILTKAAPLLGNVADILRKVKAAAPFLAPEIDPILAALEAPIAAAALVSLGGFVLPEALAIAQGKIDPKEHAGDAI